MICIQKKYEYLLIKSYKFIKQFYENFLHIAGLIHAYHLDKSRLLSTINKENDLSKNVLQMLSLYLLEGFAYSDRNTVLQPAASTSSLPTFS